MFCCLVPPSPYFAKRSICDKIPVMEKRTTEAVMLKKIPILVFVMFSTTEREKLKVCIFTSELDKS